MARDASACNGSAGLDITSLCILGAVWRYCFAWRRSYRFHSQSYLKVDRHNRGRSAPDHAADAHTAIHLGKTWGLRQAPTTARAPGRPRAQSELPLPASIVQRNSGKTQLFESRVAYPGGEASLRGPEGRVWPDDFWKKIFPGGMY